MTQNHVATLATPLMKVHSYRPLAMHADVLAEEEVEEEAVAMEAV